MSSELSDHLCGWAGEKSVRSFDESPSVCKRGGGGGGYDRMVSKGSHLLHLQALQFCLPGEP